MSDARQEGIELATASDEGSGRPATRSPAWAVAALAAVVAGLVLVVHWPALSAQALCFDDHQYLVLNPLVQDPGWASARRFLAEVLEPSTVRGYYQPLAMISLMADYAIGGRADNLWPFHRTSLALHVANTVLVVVLCYHLFGRAWPAALAGLLFGAHPFAVECISWVGERKTPLATLFALWCLVFYVVYARRPTLAAYAAVMVSYVLALLSKPTSTPLPILFLLLDYWPLRRLRGRTLLEKLPLFVIGGVSAVITIVSQARTAFATLPIKSSPVTVLLTLCHNVVFYLFTFVCPTGLSPHYSHPQPITLRHPTVLAGAIGTVILVVLLLVSLRRTRALLTGGLFFFIAILPTMGIVGFTNVIAANKFAYFPSVGLFLVLAWVFAQLWAPASGAPGSRAVLGRIVVLAVVAVMALGEATAARRYLADWKDTDALFQHMLALSPRAAGPRFSYGFFLHADGRFDDAIRQYREALRLQPADPETQNNLGLALAATGHLDEAVESYRAALRRVPNFAGAHNNLGAALMRQGKSAEAIRHCTEALRLDPDFTGAHVNLGTILARLGMPNEALEHYKEALRIEPLNLNARINLATALYDQGKVEAAIQAYQAVLEIDPRHPNAHLLLGMVLDEQGRLREAMEEYREVLRIDPHHAEARSKLDAASARQHSPGAR